MPIFTSHPAYPCPVIDFRSSDFSDCRFPLLTCFHGISCPLLTVEVFGGPINCLSDLMVEAPATSCDPMEIQDLICCAQKAQMCLSELYDIDMIHITPACTGYCGPVSAQLYVNLRDCTAWLDNIKAPFSDCA